MITTLLSESASLSERPASNLPTSTRGNVNIIGSGDRSTAVCYMPYLMGFSYDGKPDNSLGYYQGLAAILLAMEHLNTGNGTIVPDIDGINQRCPLRFATKSFDTEKQLIMGIDEIISMTDRSNTGQLIPCAILGAARSSISIPTSIISGLRGFPQISPISTSAVLDDKSQHKLFGRTIPNDDGTAIPLLSKLHNDWGVNHLAVLHVDDAYGSAYAKGIRSTAQITNEKIRIETVSLVEGADDAKIAAAVELLKKTEFTYFFGVITANMVDKVMAEAYSQKIAGTGNHTWIFSDSVGYFFTGRNYELGSPLEKAYRGASFINAVGGIHGMNSFDKLTQALQQMGRSEEDLSYLESFLPQERLSGKDINDTIITRDESFLQSPGVVAPFLYDAVVALGLASCGLVDSSGNGQYFTGEVLFEAYLNTTFNGTSGAIVFEKTGTRDPLSALFSLTNFIVDRDKSSGRNVQYKGVTTDLYRSGKWESIVPFKFNDGTNEAPRDLPYLKTNSNYLSIGMMVVGSILCAVIILLALSFSLWTKRNSEKRVVRSSQPDFLHMISAGTLVMGLAIIPWTIAPSAIRQSIADSACMAFPWPLVLGFSLTFGALFTKTRRINKIVRHSRRCSRVKISPVEVMKPMAALLALNIIILTVWTVIDPLQRRTTILKFDKFGRTAETYGKCMSDHNAIFVAILCVINLGSLAFAIFQAYKARYIPTYLQESHYIFMAMALILTVSSIGIPVIFIAKGNVSAYYFVTVGIISVLCGSILLLIFTPKVQALRKKSTGESNHARRPTLETRTDFQGGDEEVVWITMIPRDQVEHEKAELNVEIQDLTGEILELKEDIQGLTGRNEELIEEIQEYQEMKMEIKEQKDDSIRDLTGRDEELDEESILSCLEDRFELPSFHLANRSPFSRSVPAYYCS